MPNVHTVEVCQTLEDLLGEELDQLFLETSLVRCAIDRSDRATGYVFQETRRQLKSDGVKLTLTDGRY